MFNPNLELIKKLKKIHNFIDRKEVHIYIIGIHDRQG